MTLCVLFWILIKSRYLRIWKEKWSVVLLPSYYYTLACHLHSSIITSPVRVVTREDPARLSLTNCPHFRCFWGSRYPKSPTIHRFGSSRHIGPRRNTNSTSVTEMYAYTISSISDFNWSHLTHVTTRKSRSAWLYDSVVLVIRLQASTSRDVGASTKRRTFYWSARGVAFRDEMSAWFVRMI